MLDPHALSWVTSSDVASIVCPALGRGVTRSKRRAMKWLRKAAENGNAEAFLLLAQYMYADHPYAREVGLVVEVDGVASPAGVIEEHDVPPDVLTGVVHWLRKGGHDIVAKSAGRVQYLRSGALEGFSICCNDGCEVVGQLKDFKVCPQCKAARYCGDACQKQDWMTGGHKATCGTLYA